MSAELIYNFLKRTSTIGIPIMGIILILLFSFGCHEVGHNGILDMRFSSNGCEMSYGMFLFAALGALFIFVPYWIIGILIFFMLISKDPVKKIFLGFPIWTITLLFAINLILYLNISLFTWIYFIIPSILVVLGIINYVSGIRSVDNPISKSLIIMLEGIDTSKVEKVLFKDTSGNTYYITLDSIKQIALFIFEKTHKKEFSPNELEQERDFLMAYYKSNLPKDQYNILVGALSKWVEGGGSFDLVYK